MHLEAAGEADGELSRLAERAREVAEGRGQVQAGKIGQVWAAESNSNPEQHTSP